MSKLKITREQEEKLKEFEWHTTSKEHAFELYKTKIHFITVFLLSTTILHQSNLPFFYAVGMKLNLSIV